MAGKKKDEVITMDRFNINVPADLKTEFQVACLKTGSNMTDETVKFMQSFVKKVNKKIAQ